MAIITLIWTGTNNLTETLILTFIWNLSVFFTPLSICNDFAFYLSACLEIITLFLSLAVFEANEKWSGCLGFGSEVGADVHWKMPIFLFVWCCTPCNALTKGMWNFKRECLTSCASHYHFLFNFSNLFPISWNFKGKIEFRTKLQSLMSSVKIHLQICF